jgi:hypothetical protein
VFVQAFVAEFAVETLDVGVLIWFARTNKREMHARPGRPFVEHLTFELGCVIDRDGFRLSSDIRN